MYQTFDLILKMALTQSWQLLTSSFKIMKKNKFGLKWLDSFSLEGSHLKTLASMKTLCKMFLPSL
jgi:hypothetical protein